MRHVLPLLTLVGLGLLGISCAREAYPERILLNEDWRFFKGDAPEYADAAFDDSSWRTLDLPHDWGVEGPFVQSYPGETGKLEWWGTAWYRKQLRLPASLPRGIREPQYFLDFEGVMSGSTVYVNGHEAGGRPYGYSSFRVDITPWVHEGDNLVAVRVENKPNSSRWYPGGGIYRPVYLTTGAKAGVAWNGIFVRTEALEEDGAARIRVSTDLRNAGAPARLEVRWTVRAAEGGKVLARNTSRIEDGVRAETDFRIPDARLWSPSDPQLYCLETSVRNLDNGEEETQRTTFGIRTVRFTPEGFLLNGERLFLQGVCLHHDAGALGAVWNRDVWQRRLGQLKQLGCNAIRCAHNPPAPELLDLCDEMGLLAIDELTDTWTVPKKPNGYATLFDEWAERDLRDMIHRDRNHPCVMLWSIGNECAEQGYSDKWDIPRRLSEICREEDATRQTTSGNDNVWGAFQPYHETVDVFGFNYKPDYYADFHRQFPDQPYYGSETASCISSRGYYLFPVSDEKGKGWPEKAPYQVSSYALYAPWWACSPDHEWAQEDLNPSFCGEFVWSGFDYIGEPTPYNFDPTVLTNFHDEKARQAAEKQLEELSRQAPPSRSSYFGIFDLAGFPKDIYWLYQSRWRPEVRMAHILPHWNWEGREGQVTPVHVFTSADSGELFINGRSQGICRKGPGEYRLRWDTTLYEPGTVSVVTWKDGEEWARDTVRTSGAPAALQAGVEQGEGGTVFVSVRIVDAEGRFVPTATNEVTFQVEGPARLLATDAGDATSHVPFYSPSLPAFGGLCSAVLRREPVSGAAKARPDAADAVHLSITSPGLQPAEITF